jgi:hypothetical protein
MIVFSNRKYSKSLARCTGSEQRRWRAVRMAPLRVAIVGGGVGGLALAQALRHGLVAGGAGPSWCCCATATAGDTQRPAPSRFDAQS